MWHSQEQADKRWQAAKMSSLGKLIGMFPSVRSATVLYEPGSSRRLGSSAVAPTAAVKLSMKDSQELQPKLVAAIADLVAGSIAGMGRDNVRIIDGAGRSYRASEDSPAARKAMDELRAAENYYAQRVQAAISYIDNLIVVPVVQPQAAEAGGLRCVAASVSVPRSYLAAVCRTTNADSRDADDSAIATAAAQQLPKVQQAAASALGLADASAVKVDWHFDVQPDAARTSYITAAWSKPTVILSGAAAAAIVVIAALVIAIRRGRKTAADAEAAAGEEASATEATGNANPARARTATACLASWKKRPTRRSWISSRASIRRWRRSCWRRSATTRLAKCWPRWRDRSRWRSRGGWPGLSGSTRKWCDRSSGALRPSWRGCSRSPASGWAGRMPWPRY